MCGSISSLNAYVSLVRMVVAILLNKCIGYSYLANIMNDQIT